MVTPAPTIAGLASTQYAPMLAGSEVFGGLFLMLVIGLALGLVVAMLDIATRRVSE